jgi:hypothetical protein
MLLACGCPGGGNQYTRQGPEPSVKDVVDRLAKARDALHAFKSESIMDYWFGTNRVKGTVLVMGEAGAKVRFNALNPAGGDVMADLACDGTNFIYLDYQHNACFTVRAIAPRSRRPRLELEPDDSPPRARRCRCRQTRRAVTGSRQGIRARRADVAGGIAEIRIDARGKNWDVVESELKTADGRSCGRSRTPAFRRRRQSPSRQDAIQSPQQQEDLIVEWKTKEVNPQLDASKFACAPPSGLAPCGQAAPPTAKKP